MSDEHNDNAPKELREALDRATAKAEEEATKAATAVTELNQFKATTFFERAGLGGKQADLFLKTNPDAEISADSVGAFIEEYGFSVKEGAEPPKEETPPADAGLGAMAGAAQAASTGAAPAAKPKIDKAQFEQMLVDNPQKAAELYAKGQVERNPSNVQARALVQKGIIDH